MSGEAKHQNFLAKLRAWVFDTKHILATVIAGIILFCIQMCLTKTFFSTPEKADNHPGVHDTVVKIIPAPATDTFRSAPSHHPVIAKFDIALMTTSGEKTYWPLYDPLAAWIKTALGKDQLKVGNIPPDAALLQHVLTGDITPAIHRQLAGFGQYICVVKSTETYGSTELSKLLVRLDCKYELIVLQNTTGSVLRSVSKTFTCDEIDRDAARQKTDSLFLSYIHSLTL